MGHMTFSLAMLLIAAGIIIGMGIAAAWFVISFYNMFKHL